MFRIWFVALVAVGLLPDWLFAGGPCSGVKGGCGRSSYRSSASTGTVHVRGYTRKDGTYVRPHTRRAPGTAGSSSINLSGLLAATTSNDDEASVTVKPARSRFRTAARTTARTRYWGGTSSTPDDDDTGDVPAGSVDPIPPVVPAEPTAVAKFKVKFKSGRTLDIVAYEEEADGRYTFEGLAGGKTKYPKSMVISIDPVLEAQ